MQDSDTLGVTSDLCMFYSCEVIIVPQSPVNTTPV